MSTPSETDMTRAQSPPPPPPPRLVLAEGPGGSKVTGGGVRRAQTPGPRVPSPDAAVETPPRGRSRDRTPPRLAAEEVSIPGSEQAPVPP